MRQLFEPLQHGFVHCAADRIEPGRSIQTINPDDWTVRHIAGVAERDFSYEECELGQPQNSPLRTTRDSMGEWIAVATTAADPSSCLLFSDVHGYGTLFYCLIPDHGLVFAETFQGVLGALASRQVARTVDWTNYITALTANDQHFQGAFSTHSMASQVRLLGREQALFITSSGAHLVNRSALGGSFEETDFSSALDTGIEHVTALITSLSGQGMLNTLHLSGGVDSRLCLALVAAAGVTDRFQARTVDPRAWRHSTTLSGITRDVEIANEIRAEVGIQWAPTYPHAKISLSFDESVALKHTYRSSFLYELNGSNQHGMTDHRVAALRGGGGELLRATHGSQRLNRQYSEAQQENPEVDPATWRARRVARSSSVVPNLARHLRTAVRNSYRGVRADSSLTGFERHYMNYRNRSHFGHVRSSLMGNELAVHVLSNPWLLQAAQLMPMDFRIDGHVVSELFRRTAPGLLRFPFENDEWTARLTDDVVTVPASTWQASFDATNRSRDDYFLAGHEHGSRNMAWDFSARSETARLIKHHFRLLEENVPDELRRPLMEQHAHLSRDVNAGRVSAAKILAASASAADVVAPQRTSVLVAELGNGHIPWSGNAARVGEPALLWASHRS